jgi:hypothetical protein
VSWRARRSYLRLIYVHWVMARRPPAAKNPLRGVPSRKGVRGRGSHGTTRPSPGILLATGWQAVVFVARSSIRPGSWNCGGRGRQ